MTSLPPNWGKGPKFIGFQQTKDMLKALWEVSSSTDISIPKHYSASIPRERSSYLCSHPDFFVKLIKLFHGIHMYARQTIHFVYIYPE